MTPTVADRARSSGEGHRKKLKVYNRVRVMRQESGISRQELAEALGISYRTLGYIEREDYSPSLALAWKIADFFELPLEAVFAREPLPPLSELLYKANACCPPQKKHNHEPQPGNNRPPQYPANQHGRSQGTYARI